MNRYNDESSEFDNIILSIFYICFMDKKKSLKIMLLVKLSLLIFTIPDISILFIKNMILRMDVGNNL